MNVLQWKTEKDLALALDKAASNKNEDSHVYRDIQKELLERERDMTVMEGSLSDLGIWFPHFNEYSSSILRLVNVKPVCHFFEGVYLYLYVCM